MNQTIKAHLALFLVNTLYGANHILAKGVMPDFLSPTVFIVLRVAGATALFWIVKAFLPKEIIRGKDLILCAFCGLFGVGINQLFFFHGLNLSSSINSGIIMTINPILVVVIAYFWLKEPITTTKIIGVTLGTLGAILLTIRSYGGASDATLGDIFLFINAFSYAIYLVIAKPLMQKYSPLTVITYTFSFGLIFVLLYPPTLPELMNTSFITLPFDIVMKIVYVIIGVTFLTYLLTMYGLKSLSPSVSSGYIYIQPILVIGFAYLFAWMGLSADYTNSITIEKIGYMLLIFIGVYVLNRKPQNDLRTNQKSQ